MTNVRHRKSYRDSPIAQGAFIAGCLFLTFTLASIAVWMLAHATVVAR